MASLGVLPHDRQLLPGHTSLYEQNALHLVAVHILRLPTYIDNYIGSIHALDVAADDCTVAKFYCVVCASAKFIRYCTSR